MDSNQDLYILKKILYKFDKKLDLVEQEYLRQMFSFSDNPRKLSNEELLQEISALQFINFKYRTALLSSFNDLAKNEVELQSQQANINSAKQQNVALLEQYKNAEIAMQNKRKFNEMSSELTKFDKREVFDSKISAMENELRQLSDKYSRDMKKYEEKQRLLKLSISALKNFISGFSRSEQNENPEIYRNPSIQPGEDDGQVF